MFALRSLSRTLPAVSRVAIVAILNSFAVCSITISYVWTGIGWSKLLQSINSIIDSDAEHLSNEQSMFYMILFILE